MRAGRRSIPYRAVLRANFPVDHLELVWNGAVVATLPTGPRSPRPPTCAARSPAHGSGWLLLRAWNDGPDPSVMDIYPYATTSPVYVRVADKPRKSPEAGAYFLKWLGQLQEATERNTEYRTAAERSAVLEDISRARAFYENCAAFASALPVRTNRPRSRRQTPGPTLREDSWPRPAIDGAQRG